MSGFILPIVHKSLKIKRQNSSEGFSPRMSENAMSLFIANHEIAPNDKNASGIASVISDAISECSPLFFAAMSPASPCI